MGTDYSMYIHFHGTIDRRIGIASIAINFVLSVELAGKIIKSGIIARITCGIVITLRIVCTRWNY